MVCWSDNLVSYFQRADAACWSDRYQFVGHSGKLVWTMLCIAWVWRDSRAQARQLVQHGHITLNGRKTRRTICAGFCW